MTMFMMIPVMVMWISLMKFAPTFEDLMCQLGRSFLQSSHQNLTEFYANFSHGLSADDDAVDYVDDDDTTYLDISDADQWSEHYEHRQIGSF